MKLVTSPSLQAKSDINNGKMIQIVKVTHTFRRFPYYRVTIPYSDKYLIVTCIVTKRYLCLLYSDMRSLYNETNAATDKLNNTNSNNLVTTNIFHLQLE